MSERERGGWGGAVGGSSYFLGLGGGRRDNVVGKVAFIYIHFAFILHSFCTDLYTARHAEGPGTFLNRVAIGSEWRAAGAHCVRVVWPRQGVGMLLTP